MLDRLRRLLVVAGASCLSLAISAGIAKADDASTSATVNDFVHRIAPVLQEHCYGCHSDGTAEGGFSFDTVAHKNPTDDDRRKWWTVMRKLRAGTMPPVDEPAPSGDQKAEIDRWIKSDIFNVNANDIDPGRVTLRRLNRTEYRNTITDLLGIEYDTKANFPPDDTGHGFDNMGDVLSMSPLLLEKYLDAAQDVVNQSVPMVSGVPKKSFFSGSFFNSGKESWNSFRMPYKQAALVSQAVDIPLAGNYKGELHVQATEEYVEGKFDYNKCKLIFRVDGEVIIEKELVRQSWTNYVLSFDRKFDAGDHKISLELVPLTADEPSVRDLAIEFRSVTLFGPDDPAHFEKPERYVNFFGDKPTPNDAFARRQQASEIIESFATKSFRRPVDKKTVDKLTDLASFQFEEGGKSFEAGIADAFIAILASPRFLFREELTVPSDKGLYELLDEYSLASRLSYFLWSTMPDDKLMQLAAEGKLRENLGPQIDRMLSHERGERFFENFVGQWLQSRDIEDLGINAHAVVERERSSDERDEYLRGQYWQLRWKRGNLTEEEKKTRQEAMDLHEKFEKAVKKAEPNWEVKRAMRLETEMLFKHLIREDRPLQELIDSSYTFLNEPLAEYYGIDGVQGKKMQKVDLPAGNVRGGVLTQATFLAMTSNPDRTSPVKRGKFVLENLLGTPTAAPPPNIPPLEEGTEGSGGRKLSLRESLEIHRQNSLCASCHNSMDPLGLALENFNALGRYREREFAGPIDPKGKLISGDEFKSVVELKRILATKHRREIYSCVTEKLLTYALGRGIDYYDVATVDKIVDELEAKDGKAGGLIHSIVTSAPFLHARPSEPAGNIVNAELTSTSTVTTN